MDYYSLSHSFPWLRLTTNEQLWALVIPGGAQSHKAVAFSILARKPVGLELVFRTLRGVASTHFSNITFIFRSSAYGPFFLHLLKRDKCANLWCVSWRNWAHRWRADLLNLSVRDCLIAFFSVLRIITMFRCHDFYGTLRWEDGGVFFKIFSCFTICVLPAFIHAWCPQRSEEGARFLELELQALMICHVGTGNLTWVLCKDKSCF